MARPKGLAKTGGRQKGVPNKATADIKALAQEYGAEAVATLAKIMGSGEQPAAARVSAAKELLERGYGKVSQPTELTGANGGPIETVGKIDLSGLTLEQKRALASIKLPE
jgi:hypothetical protein